MSDAVRKMIFQTEKIDEIVKDFEDTMAKNPGSNFNATHEELVHVVPELCQLMIKSLLPVEFEAIKLNKEGIGIGANTDRNNDGEFTITVTKEVIIPKEQIYVYAAVWGTHANNVFTEKEQEGWVGGFGPNFNIEKPPKEKVQK